MPAQPASPHALLGLIARYCASAYGGAWAVWGLAALLGGQGGEGPGASPAGALLVIGTLMPLFAAYAVFPRLCACGLAESPDAPARAGFLRFAFGMRPTLRGWAAFGVLLVWRWAMCYIAFGFPSPGAALLNVATSWPALLLGGGLEEVGWRGCLQPALESWLRARGGSRTVCEIADPAFRSGSRASDMHRPRDSWACARAALGAPLVTGLVWGLWHLPLFAIPGTFQSTVPVGAVLLVGVALSYSFGALRYVAGNLDSCIASHAWYNAMLVATPVFGPVACFLFLVEAVGGAAVLGASWYSGRRRQ